MLDTHFFWQQTWAREGRMEVSLPHRNDTDGTHLAAQARYALVLDMITRTGEELWPRYGTAPGCKYRILFNWEPDWCAVAGSLFCGAVSDEQPGIGADGFQEIFTATMMASLEWGCFPYARGVLDNWLTYFIKDKGFILYRGLEMAQHGRMLTNIAQCTLVATVLAFQFSG